MDIYHGQLYNTASDKQHSRGAAVVTSGKTISSLAEDLRRRTYDHDITTDERGWYKFEKDAHALRNLQCELLTCTNRKLQAQQAFVKNAQDYAMQKASETAQIQNEFDEQQLKNLGNMADNWINHTSKWSFVDGSRISDQFKRKNGSDDQNERFYHTACIAFQNYVRN